jgi:hypothetical protein
MELTTNLFVACTAQMLPFPNFNAPGGPLSVETFIILGGLGEATTTVQFLGVDHFEAAPSEY